jgi:hypothetical protein
LFQKFGHGTLLAGIGFGTAKILVDLQETFAGKVGSDLEWGERKSKQAYGG